MRSIKLLLGLVFMILLSSFTSADLCDGINAYYDHDTDGTIDDSTGNHSNAVINGITYDVDGVNGGCYNIDGSGSQNANYSNGFPIPLLTACYYVRHDVTGDSASWWMAGPKGIGLYEYSGTMYEGIYAQSENSLTWSPAITAYWEHYCYSFEDSTNTFEFYVDGMLKANISEASATPTNANYILGGYAGTIFAEGDVDEIAVWNRRLTESEIISLNHSLYYSDICISYEDPELIILDYVSNISVAATNVINITVTDKEETALNVSFSIFNDTSEITSFTRYVEVSNNTEFNIQNLSGLAQGNYTFVINISDTQGGTLTNTTSFNVSNGQLNLSLSSPVNNSHWGSGIVLQATIFDPDNDNLTCELYVNGSVYVNGGTGYNFTINNTIVNASNINVNNNQTYHWFYNCTDGYNFTISETWTVFIDDNQPIINNYGVAADNTSKFWRLENFAFDISFYDPEGFLNFVQINITGEDDGILYYQENESQGEGFSEDYWWYGSTTPISGWPYQNYIMNSYANDQHTKKAWDKVKTITNKQYKKVYFDNIDDENQYFVNVEMVATDSKLKELKTNKIKDRVTFDYDMMKNKPKDHVYTYTFLVSSNQEFKYLPDSPYKAHFVFSKSKNWLDFELDTEYNIEYDVVKISEGYHVTIWTKETDLKFKSFGGLNENFQSRKFSTYEHTINVSAYYFYNKSQILSFNVSSASLPFSFDNTNNGSLLYGADENEHTIIINSSGFLPLANTSTFTSNNTIEFYLYDSILNITAFDNISNVSISNFAVNISWNGYVNTYSTNNGTISAPLENGSTYNINFTVLGYQSTTYALLVSTTYDNLTVGLLPINTTVLQFYDEETLQRINDVDLTLISDLAANNYTTATGQIAITALTDGEYQARYNSTGYNRRDYYFNVTNTTFFSTSLYLLNSSVASNVTITVIDEADNWLDNYYLKIQRFYTDINGYRTVEIVKTDFFGQETISAKLNDPYYKIIITDGVSTYLTTERFKFKELSMTIPVITSSLIGTVFEQTGNVVHSLSYDNTSYGFVFTFDDQANQVSAGCLEVYRLRGDSQTRVNHTCSTSASGSINNTVDNTTETTYLAKGVVYFDNQKIVLDQVTRTLSSTDLETWGTMGLFITAILMIVGAFIAFWNPSVMVLIQGFIITVTRLVGFHSIHWGVVVAVDVACIFIVYIISKRS